MTPLDLDAIVARTRELATDVIAPEAARVDVEGAWPERGMRPPRGAGLGGLGGPAWAGGLGRGLLGLAQVSEVLGGACGWRAPCFGIHCAATAVIAAKATPDQA